MKRAGMVLSLVALLTSSVMAEDDGEVGIDFVTKSDTEYANLALQDYIKLDNTIQIAAESIKPPTVTEKKRFRELVFRIMGQQGLPYSKDAVLAFELVVMNHLINNIAAAKIFYSDALVSIETGKAYKSEARKRAEEILLEKGTIVEDDILQHNVVMIMLAKGVTVQLMGREELTKETITKKIEALTGCIKRIHQNYFVPIIIGIEGRAL